MLRAVCRLQPKAPAEQVAKLAEDIHNWDSLIALARDHRIAALVFASIRETGASVPANVYRLLKADYDRNVFQSLANAAELIAILKALDGAAIRVMPFKGVVLGMSAYGDLATRPAGDLDLLVGESDMARAKGILIERGYRLETETLEDGSPANPDYFEFHFERPADGMMAELRWRLELTQPRFRRNLGIDWVWPSKRTAKLAGAEVPDMSPEMTLLVLCMHGCKHAWSRMIWVRDVAQLLSVNPGLDWKITIEEAKHSGLWRALALGVLLAESVCGAPIPASVCRQFENASALRLARHFDDCLFEAPGSGVPGGIPYYIQLLSFGDRMRMVISPKFLEPNERDLAAFPLPRQFHALYFLVRPIRLLLDRSARR